MKVVLTGVLAPDAANLAYVDSLGALGKGPWILPHPDSLKTRCDDCKGVLHVGPRALANAMIASVGAERVTVEKLCPYDAILRGVVPDDPMTAGA